VVRWTSWAPTRCSSALIARVTAGGEKPSWRAAGAKPRNSVTVTKTRRLSSRSMRYSSRWKGEVSMAVIPFVDATG
jgi:hypothetical protein